MAPLVAAGATAWLVCILIAPDLPATIATAVYAVGSLVCHQLPERSFHRGGYQLPVCARCLGIYAGAACGALIGAVLIARASSRMGMSARAARWFVGVGAMPTLISVALEMAGAWQTTNAMRFGLGLPLGLASAFVVMSALATLHYKECEPRRPTVPRLPPPI